MPELSLEPRTEYPRVENTVITAISIHPEGSDLIGAFFCLMCFCVTGIFLSCFHLILPAMAEKVC